jgi:hypothetical protein
MGVLSLVFFETILVSHWRISDVCLVGSVLAALAADFHQPLMHAFASLGLAVPLTIGGRDTFLLATRTPLPRPPSELLAQHGWTRTKGDLARAFVF